MRPVADHANCPAKLHDTTIGEFGVFGFFGMGNQCFAHPANRRRTIGGRSAGQFKAPDKKLPECDGQGPRTCLHVADQRPIHQPAIKRKNGCFLTIDLVKIADPGNEFLGAGFFDDDFLMVQFFAQQPRWRRSLHDSLLDRLIPGGLKNLTDLGLNHAHRRRAIFAITGFGQNIGRKGIGRCHAGTRRIKRIALLNAFQKIFKVRGQARHLLGPHFTATRLMNKFRGK